MSYSEMIHAYFDEGLDGFLEDVLFEKLAQSAELRREFTEHLRLHQIIQQDAAASTPPVDVTRAIFAGLQVAPPVVPAVQPPVAASPERPPVPSDILAASRRRSRRSHAMTSAATAIALLIMFWIIRPFETIRVEYADSGPRTQATQRTIATEATPSNVPVARSYRPSQHPSHKSTEQSIAASDKVIDVTRQIADASVEPSAIETSDEPSAVETQENATPAALPAPAIADLGQSASPANPADEDRAPEGKQILAATPVPVADVPDMPVGTMPAMEQRWSRESMAMFATLRPGHAVGDEHAILPAILSHFQLEMRVMNGRSNPQVNLPYSSANLFKDIAFSVAYKVDERNAIGLEYGRETFGQEYTSFETETDPLVDVVIRSQNELTAPWMTKTYTRNMLLDWVGATWKVSFKQFEMLSIVYPYMRAFLGATRQGPIGKMRIGLEIAPTKFTMFNIGLEGSFLRYEVDQMWNKTTKLGITFGLAAGF
jgi:hypothetical protein